MGEEKRPGEEQAKEENGGSSGGSEREVERLNERCRKPMKNNFHCWRGGHRRCGARPEHCTHPSRLERRARFLTLFAQRTGAAMANAGGIQHAQGAVAFWPTFLHEERMACWAAQRPIGLRGKHGTGKPMHKRGSRPVRWPVGR